MFYYHWLTKPVTLSVRLASGDTPLNLSQKQPILVVEQDAAGNNVPVVAANLSYTIADPTVATVSTDANGNPFVVAVAVGNTLLTVHDTINNLTGTVTVDVTAVADVPTVLLVTLGPAVAA